MMIHVVQSGETIDFIARKYNVPKERMIRENGIKNPENLVIGQTIVITYPKRTYLVKEGDSLRSISEKEGISLKELIRNNPFLINREFIYPGETLIISFETKKSRSIVTNGYAYPYINKDTLKKTLPYLTYLTVFNYRITEDGELVDIEDSEIILSAKDYGVAPLMLISTLTEQGTGNRKAMNQILEDACLQDKLINNISDMLKRKGYYGLNIYIQYLTECNQPLIEIFVKRLTDRLHGEGFRVELTLTPRPILERTDIYLEDIDYTNLSQFVDTLQLLSYEWGYSYGPPACVTPINLARAVLDFTIRQVAPETILLGIPVIGYNWNLPYIIGESKANAITAENAIRIAETAGVPIQFSDISQAPYFFYENYNGELHIVWFKDARSINALLHLIPEYELQGVSIWNIMNYFSQLWLIINVNFDIENVYFL